jgi:hypothetical protein
MMRFLFFAHVVADVDEFSVFSFLGHVSWCFSLGWSECCTRSTEWQLAAWQAVQYLLKTQEKRKTSFDINQQRDINCSERSG